MILEGHAIKITNIKDFKDIYSIDIYNDIYKRLIHDKECNDIILYYCIYHKNKTDWASEWWVKELNNYIVHESLKDYYKYINPIINYTDI